MIVRQGMLLALALAVLAATWIPARRAASVDPSEALREGKPRGGLSGPASAPPQACIMLV